MKTYLISLFLLTIVMGFDIMDLDHKQSLLIIHYSDRPDDQLLLDNKYLKNKTDISNIVEKILTKRNAY